MYTLVNEDKKQRAQRLARQAGFKSDDQEAVVAFYARLGGLILDEDGVRVPWDKFTVPTKKVAKVAEQKEEVVKPKKEEAEPKKKVTKKK